MIDNNYNSVESMKDILCCPACKGNLLFDLTVTCRDCFETFPQLQIALGTKSISTIDTMTKYPDYCRPETYNQWEKIQFNYEDFHNELLIKDELEIYLSEIDSVKEIYCEEFRLSGSVLDIGGHQGRLRSFLKDDVTRYVSIEPYASVFNGLERQPNLLSAYPFLLEPHNFIVGSAERLPFKSNTFDWVHMRSVLDHFLDPYVALKEAYRVLKPGGTVLIGIAILEKIIIQQSGVPVRRFQSILSLLKNWVLPAPVVHVDDEHVYHFSYNELVDLLKQTCFEIKKEHWQKSPYYYCLYVSATAVKNT